MGCCCGRDYEPIPDKSTHGGSPGGAKIQKLKDDLARGEEDKRRAAEAEKQKNLNTFLKGETNISTLTIPEQMDRLRKNEAEKQAKAAAEKQEKLETFTAVGENSARGNLERIASERSQKDKEKAAREELEKKKRLAEFVAPVSTTVAPTSTPAVAPTVAPATAAAAPSVPPTTPAKQQPVDNERIKSTNEKFEEAKRNKQNLEERLAKLKADRLKKN